MSYFIPSSIQKRLLRYALSRVELLDTDALDLERLDVEWGRRSTVELRDVGLRKQKLTSLLNIPEYLKLEHASIRLLRVTIPADIHTSAIIFEIQGVEARLRLLRVAENAPSKPDKIPETSVGSQPIRRPRREVKFAGLRSSVQQEGSTLSSEDEDEEEDALPTPHDLAASFLAEEPFEEKEQLEAALNSQSTADLRESTISTGSGDEETNVGTGLGVGLPAFLAAFLKGVGNRLQVQIKNVAVKVEVDIDKAGAPGSDHSGETGQECTTIALFVEEVDVGEVEDIPLSTDQAENKKSEINDSATSDASTEKRRIILREVFASILSDHEVLPTPSPVHDKKFAEDVILNPVATPKFQDDTLAQLHKSSPSIDSLEFGENQFSAPFPGNYTETILGSSEDGADDQFYFDTEALETLSTASLPAIDSEQTAEQRLRPSSQNAQLLSELEDAILEQSDAYSKLSGAERPDTTFQSTPETYSEHLHSSLRDFRKERSPSASSSRLRARSGFSRSPSPEKMSTYPPRSISPSVGALRVLPHRSSSFGTTSSISTEVAASKAHATDLSSPDMDSTDDSLTQSLMFSRDEAESIYMSVMSEPQVSASKHLHVPGAWDDASDLDVTGRTSTPNELEPRNLVASATSNGNTAKPGVTTIQPPEFTLRKPKHGSSPAERLEDKAANRECRPALKAISHSINELPMGRTFLRVGHAEFWISSSKILSEGLRDRQGSTLNRSQQPTLPGSFSLYAESKSFLRGSSFASRANLMENMSETGQPSTTKVAQGPVETLYELILHSVQAKTDVFTSRIFLEIFQKIRCASNTSTAEAPSKNYREPDTKPSHAPSSSFGMRVNDLTIEFLEVLESQIVSTTIEKDTQYSSPQVAEERLFIMKARDLDFTSKKAPITQSKLDIGKLSFGFNDQDIISFGKQAKIRSSMRNLQSSDDKDVSIIFGMTKKIPEITMSTKPIQIMLNLQRLDNTLGSVGGLSGLMELGNSVASETTIIAPPSKIPRTRSVHFEKTLPASSLHTPSQKSRFNVRIGGATLCIEGKDSNVKMQSTAIKLVGRDDILGLQIDDIRLTGPHKLAQESETGMSIRLKNTGLKYLHVPEEHDLTRLISLLTPSKDKFEDDDDFLVDTLIRQRRKGAVLRTNVAKFEFKMHTVDAIKDLQDLLDEAAKMSTVAKYIPEESRPGLMILGQIDHAILDARTEHKIGSVSVELKAAEFAHINLPLLVAVSLGKIAVVRKEEDPVITEVLSLDVPGQPPMLMARMIGDELEPTIKLKMWNMCFEYNVPLIMALLDIPNSAIQEDGSIDLGTSIAALIEPRTLGKSNSMASSGSHKSGINSKPLAINLALRDCAVGLTPRDMPSKAVFVVTDGRICGALPDSNGLCIMVELRKAGMLIIDDARKLASDTEPPLANRNPSRAAVSNHIPDLCSLGFVSVSAMSAATVMVKLIRGSQEVNEIWDIEFRDELFVLETCADSTQTLVETLNGLKPPFPPSKGQKYRTEVTPMQDMMASFTGDAFAMGAPEYRERTELGLENISDEDLAREFDDLSDFADMEPHVHPMLGDRLRGYSSAHLKMLGMTDTESKQAGFMDIGGSRVYGASTSPTQVVGKKWDSTNNRYITVDTQELASCPIQIRVRDLHIIWNMFDGYDWERTRDTITKAVQVVEAKAEERRFGRRLEEEEDKESVIGDFLFNSIYIGIPVNQDPQELTRQINRNLDDLVSETASHTSTANSRPSSSHRAPRNQNRKLKLERSKRHKVAFELRGVSADIFAFAPGGETQTSIDLRITDFEIFDHVPTSTWKKFATYMHDAGPRYEHKPMVHLEICDVKPVPELTATEMVIRVTVLPVRLHVDQDALDFITRFFDFQDDTNPVIGTPAEQPYLQRVEVRAVPIKLDYKPKKVDYAGLRSGRTTEFMNFFILDGADMVLKHTIVYGTSGFLKLHKSLEDVWMPDIRRNQLPSVLSGLNGVRSLVNMGTGIRDLVVIPVQEYRKDGKIVRSISKGALAFAKTTGGELTRFGAKLAIGAQTALQGAEDFFVKPPGHYSPGDSSAGGDYGWEGGDIDTEERRAISHYANQPTGILQGLKGAARSLERDLLVTKDVIIAVSGEARESGTAEGAARAVVRHAPTLILRPMIGASKAISQTLMGATNTVDPQNRRRIEDKYKRY